MRLGSRHACALALSAVLPLGCAAEPSEGEDLGSTDEALTRVCGAAANGPVQGYDVSYYQGAFNWNGRGVAFGYARISDGTSFIDPQFGGNWQRMRSAGVLRGAYQFFEPGEDEVAQANLVISKIGRLGPGDLPAMIDVEATGGQSPATIARKIRHWLQLVEAGTGRRPIIYTGAYFWQDHVGDASFGAYPLWIAAYGPSCPSLPNGWNRWLIWQYSDGGGSLDHDVFNGSLADLRALANGGGGGGGGGGGADCSVHPDKKLYCTNSAHAAMHSAPTLSSGVVNHLETTYSWFDCWGIGDRHAGGNTTWYHTIGDDNGNAGWVPAVDLETTSAFDANPSAKGLPACGAPPPPPEDPSCSVHGDGRLWCTNAAGAPIHASATNGSGVVDDLRTTTSWFDCWTTGDLHAGGNRTWYHTQGDDAGRWGYVPAVDLNTSSGFDANPGAHGLRHCD